MSRHTSSSLKMLKSFVPIGTLMSAIFLWIFLPEDIGFKTQLVILFVLIAAAQYLVFSLLVKRAETQERKDR